MGYTLLTFSIITKRDMSFRYFVSDKDWYEELHMEIEYNMYDRCEMEKTIVDRGLKEIAFNEIKDYSFDNTMDIAVYDGFDVYNESDVPHYALDYDAGDFDTLFFGHMDDWDFENREAFDVNDIVKPIIGKFDGKYDSSADTVYLIPVGGSMDEEYALGYKMFSNENDADLYLSLCANGEVAPYIFINDAYCVAIDQHPILKHVEHLSSRRLPALLKTKNVVVKQPIFTGLDIYN